MHVQPPSPAALAYKRFRPSAHGVGAMRAPPRSLLAFVPVGSVPETQGAALARLAADLRDEIQGATPAK